MEGPREAQIEEFEDLMGLLCKAYNYKERDWFSIHYPLLYRKSSESLKNNFIIKDNGKIVAHIGLFPREVMVGNNVLRVGGIGGVATDPEYRARGLMRSLIEFCITKMQREDYAFSVLGGARQRYANFGWEFGGAELIFYLTSRSLEWKGVKPVSGKQYKGDTNDLERIIAIHEKEDLKVKRTLEDYALLMQKSNIEVWLSERAYIVVSGEDKIRPIVECGGEPFELVSLVFGLIQKLKVERLIISRPYEYSLLNAILLEASERWNLELLRAIKIISLRRTLEGFQGQMEERRNIFKSKEKDIMGLKIVETDEQISLIFDDKILISNKKVSKMLSFSEREMVKFLFGFMPPDTIFNKMSLIPVLPLNFYIWKLDRV